jgi:citrate lyase subunit beta / citryl-CoA lyase
LPDWENVTMRAMLFAPADHSRRLQRLGDFGADVVVLDLEDAVADERKDVARSMARAALSMFAGSSLVCVRVNDLSTGRTDADVQAVVCPELDLLMIPKLQEPSDLADFDRLVTGAETRAGIDPGSIRVLGLVESARGLVAVDEIARTAPERLHTLVFGAADFAADMGFDLTGDALEILHARSRIMVAVRAAGLPPALDGPYLQLSDLDGFVADTRRSRQLGFQGRVVIHPSQVEPAQRAYSELSAQDAELAARIVEEFEAAQAAGVSSVRVGDTFVDHPIYARARQKLTAWQATQE